MLLLTALRTHFPFSQEVRNRATVPTPTAAATAATFTRVARRYTALQRGIPQQELRVPVAKTRRDIYVWTFAENLLVYQSGNYPHAVLSLLYFDYSATPRRRLRRGSISLAARGETTVRVRVCRDILVVERMDERVVGPSRTNFVASAECFRLRRTGEHGVSADRISVIEMFEFSYIDYSHQILSDHSGTYYAAYSKSSGLGAGVGVWEIATGRKVKRIAPAMLEGLGGMMTDLLVVREAGAHKVVMIGNDMRNNNARRWDRFPGEWGYQSNVCIFPVDGDEEPKAFVGRAKADCPRNSNLLTLSFKVPRLPGGLECTDTGEAEEAALVLWELEDHTDQATAHYHTLSSAALSRVRGADSPIAADVQYRIQSQSAETGLRPAPFAVKTRDSMSFTMDFTGRNEDFGDTRLMLYRLRIQAFYPSPTEPGVMELAWGSCLKKSEAPDGDSDSDSDSDAESRKRNTKNRGIYSASRNVSYLNYYGMEVVGDERAVVFLELKEGGMDLVIVVWDDPFEDTIERS